MWKDLKKLINETNLFIIHTGSCRYCMTPSIICGKRVSICLWHPSPIAEMAISAACLNKKKKEFSSFFLGETSHNFIIKSKILLYVILKKLCVSKLRQSYITTANSQFEHSTRISNINYQNGSWKRELSRWLLCHRCNAITYT